MTRRGITRPKQRHRERTKPLAGKPTFLWISDSPAPPNLRRALGERWQLQDYAPDRPLGPQLSAAGLAIIHLNGQADDAHRLAHLLTAIEQSPVVVVAMLSEPAEAARNALSRRPGQCLCVPEDASSAELSARLGAAEVLQPAVASLQVELAAAKRAAAGAGRALEDMTEEMRLAARLQRDFLPRRLPEVGPVRFGVLFRPLSWVSGDLYDVVRLDETHMGFYVADVVGHGMPAALLTMFIKKALQTKRITGHTYQIIPPHVSLAELNSDICEQNLSSCQFCTAVYCVLDLSTGMLTFARAGHPEPILIHADRTAEKLLSPGCLLGVFPEERYESRQAQLAPGDRLLIYTDGAETALCGLGREQQDLTKIVAPLAGLPCDEMLLQLTSLIDEAPRGSVDDVTIVVMDMKA